MPVASLVPLAVAGAFECGMKAPPTWPWRPHSCGLYEFTMGEPRKAIGDAAWIALVGAVEDCKGVWAEAYGENGVLKGVAVAGVCRYGPCCVPSNAVDMAGGCTGIRL